MGLIIICWEVPEMRISPKRDIADILFSGKFGLEEESLRLTLSGHLASSDHPFEDEVHMSKDFCESQLEIITDPHSSIDELYRDIRNLRREANKVLRRRGEILNDSSNPPATVDPEEARIALFDGEDKVKTEYRRYLCDKYGKSRMLLSGIHFNMSFDDAVFELSGLKGEGRDRIYLDIAAKALKYSWLITYLTAASPEGDKASVRCSSDGYWNDFTPILDYTSLDGYVDSIRRYEKTGQIYNPWELYIPVRVKPYGKNTLDNLKRGISHIELRMFDINPADEAGININDLKFAQLLLIYFLLTDPVKADADVQESAVKNMKQAALLDDTLVFIEAGNIRIPIREAALMELAMMEYTFDGIDGFDISSIISYQRSKLLRNGGRYCSEVRSSKEGLTCANYSDSVRITV